MNIVIVGLGSIAKKHIDAISAILNPVTLFALRHSKESRTTDGVINISSLEDIKDKKIDFAIISNPTSFHAKTIESLLVLNCPLFIEKPLSDNLDVGKYKDVLSKLNVLTYVACNLRFLDSLLFVKEKLQEEKKRINEVNIYCGSYLPDWRPGTEMRKSYSANVRLGGGVHLDLIHELDYAYWLFGEPEKISRILKSQSSLSLDVCDYANYTFEYKGFCANIVLNYFRRDTKRTLELVFENDTWVVDLVKNQVTSNEKILFESGQIIKDTYKQQLEYFVQLVKNGSKHSMNSFFEAYKVLELCLA